VERASVSADANSTLPSVVYARRVPEETILYQTIAEHLPELRAQAEASGRSIPAFVERELRRYLECGILDVGFLRLRCTVCKHDRVLAFACKGRGFCPSCGGRRMADTAAFLVDRVLPVVPVRQWVLSLPIALRYKLAYDSKLAVRVFDLFVRSVFASLRRRARARYGRSRYECGSVTFLQRAGDAINLNPHFHAIVLDGVFDYSAPGTPQFKYLPPRELVLAQRAMPLDAQALGPLTREVLLVARVDRGGDQHRADGTQRRERHVLLRVTGIPLRLRCRRSSRLANTDPYHDARGSRSRPS
jgi:hypothetical protein